MEEEGIAELQVRSGPRWKEVVVHPENLEKNFISFNLLKVKSAQKSTKVSDFRPLSTSYCGLRRKRSWWDEKNWKNNIEGYTTENFNSKIIPIRRSIQRKKYPFFLPTWRIFSVCSKTEEYFSSKYLPLFSTYMKNIFSLPKNWIIFYQ